MSRFKFLTDLSSLAVGEFVSKALGIAAFAYLARVLGSETYGAVELAGAMSLFFTMTIDSGLGPIGVREIASGRGNVSELAAQVPAARLLIALFAVPIMGAGVWLMGHPWETVLLVWLFAAALLAEPWKQQWLLQGIEMMGGVAAAQVIRTAVFAGAVMLLVQGPQQLLWVGGAELLAMVAMALFFVVLQHTRVTPLRWQFSVRTSIALIREGISVGVAQIIWALHLYLPIILVALWLGPRETGWFGAAHRLVVPLMVFGYLYHLNLFPSIAQRVGKSGEAFDQLVRCSVRVVAWVGILFALALACIAEPMMTLLYGEEFAASSTAFAALIWIVPITAIAGHARWSLVAAGRQKFVMIAQGAGAVTMIILGVVLIPTIGMTGAVVAMLGANLIVWIVSHACAAHYLDHFPAISLAWRPIAAALILGMSGYVWGSQNWVTAAAVIFGFVTCAVVFDQAVIGDLRFLMNAKSAIAPLPGYRS